MNRAENDELDEREEISKKKIQKKKRKLTMIKNQKKKIKLYILSQKVIVLEIQSRVTVKMTR